MLADRFPLLLSFIFLMVIIVAAEVLCPFTKVEESFNMQAMHDFLYASDTARFDHHDFPGVVPRTFLGAWLVALLALLPLASIEQLSSLIMSASRKETPDVIQCDYQSAAYVHAGDLATGIMREHPMFLSHLCRLVLGALTLASLWSVATSIVKSERLYHRSQASPHTRGTSRCDDTEEKTAASTSRDDTSGATTSTITPAASSTAVVHEPHASEFSSSSCVTAGALFLALCACQFHLVFYATRPLPNTFGLLFTNVALACVLRGRRAWAVASVAAGAALFRCDLLVLLAPLGILLMFCDTHMIIDERHRHKREESNVKESPLRRFCRMALAGVVSAGVWVTMTVPGLDSFLWGKWLWPELVVLIFNTAENRSSEWSVAPAHWYVSYALPRALLFVYPLVIVLVVVSFLDMRTFRSPFLIPLDKTVHDIAVNVTRRYRVVLMASAAFVLLYSALPHKELRFVMVVFPWMLAPVAVVLAEILSFAHHCSDRSLRAEENCSETSNKKKTTSDNALKRWRMSGYAVVKAALAGVCALMMVSVVVSIAVSRVSYSGGTALKRLEGIMRRDVETNSSSCAYRKAHQFLDFSTSPTSSLSGHQQELIVFLDAYAAMSGINRFQKQHIAGHSALTVNRVTVKQEEGDEGSFTSVVDTSLSQRWAALARLPLAGLVSATRACLGGSLTLTNFLSTRLLSAVTEHPSSPLNEEGVTWLTGRHRCSYSLLGGGSGCIHIDTEHSEENTSRPPHQQQRQLHVRYLKDPRRFLTAEEHAAVLHSTGPLSGPAAALAVQREGSQVTRAVYNASGIDYALVRATQLELHVSDHNDFELLFVEEDTRGHVKRWILHARRVLTSVLHGNGGYKSSDEKEEEERSISSTAFLLALRRTRCEV